MGKIELDHTGSGGGVTLSSDGTDLLLDGTAVGGGGGGADLYSANESSPDAQPSATGANAIAIGDSATATSDDDVAIGVNANATASGSSPSLALGRDANATSGGIAIGNFTDATGTYATALGTSADATAMNASALGNDAKAAGTSSVSIGDAYASGTASFAASIDNNTSTYGATGNNGIAIGYRAKCTTPYGIAIGRNSACTSPEMATAVGPSTTASGWYSTAIGGLSCSATQNYASALGGSSSQATSSGATVAGGLSNRASGQYSMVTGGRSNTASYSYTRAGGYEAHSGTVYGKDVWASGHFVNDGDAQTGTVVLRCQTTDATATALSTNNSATSSVNQIILPNNSVYGFTGTVIARENSSSTDDFAVWEIKGGAVRGASASTTALGSYNINKISESTGAANWSIALSADTTNGAVTITVTGEAAHNIRWVATVHTTEVTY